MHDGAKRREPLVAEEPPSKRLPPKSQAGYGSAVVAAPWNASASTVPPSTEPLSESLQAKQVDKSNPKKICLPPNILNCEMWGRTVIDFGMYKLYKDSSKSYIALRNSESPRAVAYVKWCKARAYSSLGFLRDFAQYLVYMDQQDHEQTFAEGPFILGTNAIRCMK